MDNRTLILTIVSTIVATLTHALHDGVPGLANWNKKLRLALSAGLGIVSGAIDAFANGATWKQAFTSAVAVSGSAFVMLLLEWFLSLGKGGGGSGEEDVPPVHVDTPPPGKSAGPYSAKFAALGLATALAAIPGCAGWQGKVAPVLSDAAAYIADAQEILNIIRAAESIFFLSHPDTKAQVQVEHLIGDVSQAIDVAVRATRGATELSNEELDAAWKDFRVAWAELQAVLQDTGVLGKDGKLGTVRGTPSMPEPLALRGKL